MIKYFAAGLFLLFFGLYAAGASPSLYGGDSGELIGSAAVLGISHAPGYALHVLLGKGATAALPWGGAAYRVNILSALLSAGTVLLLFFFLLGGTGRAGAALWGAALYGLFPIVWDQAQTAEVFALNNFCAALILFVVGKLPRPAAAPQAGRLLCLAGFLGGLGLANHQTLIFTAPGLFVLCWTAGGVFTDRKYFLKSLPWVLAFGVLGFSLNFFIFVRAAEHPPINFGDPDTWRRFWAVLTRREFGSLSLHPAALPFRTAATTLQELRAFAAMEKHIIGAAALSLGLAGLLWHRKRTAWLLLWILTGPVFFLLSHLSPFNTLAQWRLERFQMLPALFIAVGIGLFFEKLLEKKWRAVVLAAGGLLLWEQANLERPFFRWNTAFRDFGRNLAAQLPPRGALLIDAMFFDEPTSCLINHLLVEKKRSDLRVIYRPGTLFELFYGEDFLELPRSERPARQEAREAELWRNLSRPLSVMALVRDRLPPLAFQFHGLLYQKDAAPPPAAIFVRRDRARPPPADYPTRLILVHYSYFGAKESLEAGDKAGLARNLREARAVGRSMEWLDCNIGSLLSQSYAKSGSAADLQNAKRAFLDAVAADPYFPQGPFGLGYVFFSEKNDAQAIKNFTTATRLDPHWPEAFYMLGVAHSSAGEPEAARRAFETFLTLDPQSPLAGQVTRLLSSGQKP